MPRDCHRLQNEAAELKRRLSYEASSVRKGKTAIAVLLLDRFRPNVTDAPHVQVTISGACEVAAEVPAPERLAQMFGYRPRTA
jgi:hypothetical protein